jgi:VIT1/CCC1 family predicted Fe2+/Mn2+ transporter
MSEQHGGLSVQPSREHHHRDIGGGAARAAVFGMSDGLVTNVALILGVAGADTHGGFVRLAGLAGLIAGALSMAAGEYVSMRAQTELLERELEIERRELHHNPRAEHAELTQNDRARAVELDVARAIASELMANPEMALETHAREELGINPRSLGSPMAAAAASFATFGFGALVPLLPWLFTSGLAATAASIILGLVAAVGVGVALATYTGRPRWYTAGRQVIFTAVPAVVTWLIGWGIGIST